MAATYSLGVFNDNFFKQTAMLIAVGGGQGSRQGAIVLVFTLPYLLFSAYAGWLADRFPKRRVVIASKVLEVAAMVWGAIGIVTVNWPLVLTVAFVMGAQSAIFSPALNGSIPELYPAAYVVRANGILKMVVTASILFGVVMAGIALNVKAPGVGGVPAGRTIVAAGVIVVALLGMVLSLGVADRPAADSRSKFPWTGPLRTLRQLCETRRDPLLLLAIAGDTFVWSAGALAIILINEMGLKQFHLSEGATSGLVAAELIGIGIGGLAVGSITKNEQWHRVLVPSSLALAVLMTLMAGVPRLPAPVQVPSLYLLLGLMGIAGGTFLIPCDSFVQVRPAPERKGAVISAANFAVFTGILLSGPVGNLLNSALLPTRSFSVMGGVAAFVCGALALALHRWGKA